MNAAMPKGFDEFWKNYPRRVGKLAAMKAYARALRLTTPEKLARGAQLYADERTGKDSTFTAHPATWLNAGRWDDYPERDSGVLQSDTVGDVGFYAGFCSAELDAWNAYGRRTKGMNYPQDKRGGWMFPTRWPPGHEVARFWTKSTGG